MADAARRIELFLRQTCRRPVDATSGLFSTRDLCSLVGQLHLEPSASAERRRAREFLSRASPASNGLHDLTTLVAVLHHVCIDLAPRQWDSICQRVNAALGPPARALGPGAVVIDISSDEESRAVDSAIVAVAPADPEPVSSLVPAVADPIALYRNMPHEDLSILAWEHVEKSRQLRAKVKVLQQRLRRARKVGKSARKRARLTLQDADDARLFQIVRMGRQKVTAQTQCAMAIRRTVSGCSATKLGCAVLADISCQSVSRYEVRAWAALVASSQHFYGAYLPMGEDVCATHVLRGDATNSSVWQRRKLHCLEVVSGVVLDPAALCNGDWVSGVATHKRYADLQAVSSGSGPGQVGLFLKQLRSP